MQTQPTQPPPADDATPVAGLLDETYARDPADPTICVADGYGIRITVDKGHLVIHDGVGNHRRTRRYPKAGHGLRRLVLIGHTGTISLEALRWLDKTRIAFIHLDNDGRPLTTTAAYGLDDARLRRVQALAAGTDTGLAIVVQLLQGKLAGQADVAATQLDAPDTAATITQLADALPGAPTVRDAMQIEAAAAAAYFATWQGNVTITFARKHLPRVPDHWPAFAGRRSLISNFGAYKAADPINALLNYLYALAEAETRLACLTLGLDPGLGLLHADSRARDSLALDLLEPIRPHVDRYVLDLLRGHVFRRSDFHETGDGHVRVLSPLTHALAATLPVWGKAGAPWVESVAHALADASDRPLKKTTALSGTKRRIGSATSIAPPSQRASAPRPAKACEDCGSPLSVGQRTYCPICWPAHRQQAGLTGSARAAEAMQDAATRAARAAAVSAGKRRARDLAAIALGFEGDCYESQIAPHLTSVQPAAIAAATGLSSASASGIRAGTRRPHPRHWQALLDLVASRVESSVLDSCQGESSYPADPDDPPTLLGVRRRTVAEGPPGAV